MTDRTWLHVPYADKDAAKAAGARWDPAGRAWYAGPRADLAALARWAPLPTLLPGEDRGFGDGLFVDLVPSSCWFTNVRTCVAAGDWDRLRRMVYGRAGGRCEACGRGPDPAAGVQLEAHERWAFDTAAGVQRLARLICLCSDCHAVTHFGLTAIRGREQWALEHLEDVAGVDPQEAIAHVEAAFALWQARSGRVWSLDLSMLTGAGITLAVPPGAAERAAHAERTAAAYRAGAGGQPAQPQRLLSVAGGNVPGHETAAGAGGEDEVRSMAHDGRDQDDDGVLRYGADDAAPYGYDDARASTGPKVTVTSGGLPSWALTAPIEQITFLGPNAEQQRAALLELRADAARARQPAPAPHLPAPTPHAPGPHVVPAAPAPTDAAPEAAAAAAPRPGRRWPWRRTHG